MYTSSLSLRVDPQVFNVVDPRVDLVRQGKLSIEGFALTVRPDDVFVLLNGTIHVLTEAEYYILKGNIGVNELPEIGFSYVLDLPDKSFMHKMDQDYLEDVKNNMSTCTACSYRRYRDSISKIIHKYNIKIPTGPEIKSVPVIDYPDTTEPIIPVVSVLMDKFFNVDMPDRRDCIDCVEKHISQAYILGNEFTCGYQEHLPLIVGHLSEAVAELPKDCDVLRCPLEFCLAYTYKHRKPFVPIGLLFPLINICRARMDQSMDNQADSILEARTDDMALEFSPDMRDEFVMLPKQTLYDIREILRKADNISSDESEETRIEWQGLVATAADMCAQVCPLTANMLRNRRLMFVGDTTLAMLSGFSFSDIISYIDICLALMN